MLIAREIFKHWCKKKTNYLLAVEATTLRRENVPPSGGPGAKFPHFSRFFCYDAPLTADVRVEVDVQSLVHFL